MFDRTFPSDETRDAPSDPGGPDSFGPFCHAETPRPDTVALNLDGVATCPRSTDHASASSQMPDIPLSTCFFSVPDGRNFTTRRGAINASSPLLGFRPIRAPLRYTEKLPNEDIFTVSPADRHSEIASKSDSTMSAESRSDNPVSLRTALLR